MTDIRKYYHNGKPKHIIRFYPNGNKYYERYYNKDGRDHNNSGPDYQRWNENGFLVRKTFCINGEYYNICNPAVIWYFQNGKIEWKFYYINHIKFNKLNWQNKIKYV